MPHQTEIPNADYKAAVLAQMLHQTEYLRRLAEATLDVADRMMQVEARTNQILARVAATEERFAATERQADNMQSPRLIAGGIGFTASEARRINAGEEFSDAEWTEIERRHNDR